MKKITALAISFVLAIVVLGGCSNSRTTSSNTEPTSTPTATVKPTPTETPKADTSTNFVEKVNGNRRFKMTKEEFIKKYDNMIKEADPDETIKPNLSSARFTTKSREEFKDYLAAYPNTYKYYNYDTTVSSSRISRHMCFCEFIVDEQDYIISVTLGRLKMALQTDVAINYFENIECAAVYAVMTDSTMESAKKVISTTSGGDNRATYD